MKRSGFHRLVSLTVVIAILMTVNSFVYADETNVDEDTVTDASVAEEVPSSEGQTEDSYTEATEELEETDETEVSGESVETVETQESTESEVFDDDEEIVFEETVVIDYEYDNDYLAEQYIMQQMAVGPQATFRSYNYAEQLADQLNEYNLCVYEALIPQIIAVAGGTRTSTSFTVQLTYTAEQLGLSGGATNSEIRAAARTQIVDSISTGTIIDALMNAYPYEMYWYDKTAGTRISGSIGGSGQAVISYTFDFSVAEEYKGDGDYTVTTIYGQALSDAAANAEAIIDRYAAYSDYEKLVAYRDEICDMVSYNHPAADNNNTPYGNPWQMIWVFDGDDDTTVVCEGYSKAFQFLCDNTNFQNDDIYAISVTGTMYSPSGSGGHMWNVVHMDDGYNYLVDVTNWDSGNEVFLRGWSENTSNPNIYDVARTSLHYSYDDDTTEFYSSSDLTLNTEDYEPPEETPDISVTGVLLNESQLGLVVGGETATLVATVLPQDATDQNVTWMSSNSNVVTVSETGVVTPVSAGAATITVTTDDGGFTASCEITVQAAVVPSGVEINSTNFPDANFRSYVSVNCDTDDDGYLSDDEIEAVTVINVFNCSITNLDGIKFFTSLEVLSCDQNQLTSIDVSGMSTLESLVCKSNQITSIDVSGCPLLQEIVCDNNNLTSLDISEFTTFYELRCSNNQLESLTLCPSLMLLDCHDNSLTSLNIISCPNIVSAYTTGTRSQDSGYSTYQNASGTLTVDDSVNVIASTTVSVTGVTLNQSTLSLTSGGNTATLESTVLPEDATDKSVTWSSNNESVATVSSTGVVTPLSAGSATITVTTTDGSFTASCIVTVTSSAAPTGVEINSTSFPDENFRDWVSENCDSDNDGYLSSSEISAVTEIVVAYKDIHDLTGIEYFTELVTLNCSDNSLTSLDLSHNTKLEYLDVGTYFMRLYQHEIGNQITSLDLSHNPNLTYLNCNFNALTSLDLRNNPLLTHLEAESYNYLVSGESDYVRVTPPLTSIDISNNSLLEYVDLAMNELTSLDFSGYTHLEYLRCDGNDLYELNVDGCTNLKELDCCDNDLTGIDVRSCSRLESLGIALNPMPHLDVNGMTSLKRLTGYGCGMITIDISGCSSLMYLDCHRNSLSIINVSGCPLLVCAYVNGDYSSDPWDRYSYNAGSGDEAVHYEIMANTGCIIKVSELVPGWDTIDGHGCYVNPDGTYATGVQTIEGSVYCFADDGVMFTDGWVTVNGARYYCQSNGKAYVNTTQVIDGVTYVFDNQGKCVSETPVVSTVNMYRLYNPNSGEHFYTSNAGERDLLASLGWHDEGIGWIAPATSSTPVYRLYNANGGEHHYTTSVAERDFLVSIGWNDEGIGWYSDDAHSVPLYRQYNPNAFANNHNYTTSLSENNWLVSIGWQAEGIGWYGVG